MKKILIGILVLGCFSSYASDKTCESIYAGKVISNMEMKSFRARQYDNFTSGYMRFALNEVKSQISTLSFETELSAITKKDLIDYINYEVSDTYRYDKFTEKAVRRAFSKINNYLDRLYADNCN